MKKMRDNANLVLIFCLMFLPVTVIGQGPDFGDDGDQVYDVADVPFDGGVALLVAAGIGYGLKKVLDQRKKAGSNNYISRS